MSGSVNKMIILGNLTKDPEIRSMQNGKEVASFTVATSESWKDKSSGERKQASEFHKVVIFSEGLVKLAGYLKKGSKVYVEGSLKTRSYENNEGTKQYIVECVLQGFNASMVILDGKMEKAESNERPDLDDSIPF